MNALGVHQLVDDVKALAELHLDGQFHAAGGDGLAAQTLHLDAADEIHDLRFGGLIVMGDEQEGVRGAQAEERQRQHRDGNARDDDQRDGVQLRAEQNAHRQAPEHVSRVERILDGRAETHDGERADHAHGERDIGLDAHDDRGGNHAQHNQRVGERRGKEHAAEGLAIDQRDNQADDKAHQQRQQHLHRGEAGHLLCKPLVYTRVVDDVLHGNSSIL